jgi:hypothetical protein
MLAERHGSRAEAGARVAAQSDPVPAKTTPPPKIRMKLRLDTGISFSLRLWMI